MSTNASISIEKKDGTVESVFCRWDGYLSHTGAVLYQHYDSADKVQSLIDRGNVSFLKETIETTEFAVTQDEIDSGEWNPRDDMVDKFVSLDQYWKCFGAQEAFNYIFNEKKQKWYVVPKNHEDEPIKLKPLSKCLIKDKHTSSYVKNMILAENINRKLSKGDDLTMDFVKDHQTKRKMKM